MVRQLSMKLKAFEFTDEAFTGSDPFILESQILNSKIARSLETPANKETKIFWLQATILLRFVVSNIKGNSIEHDNFWICL